MSDFWKGRRVLVTGGRGFVGAHVARLLTATRGVASTDVVTPGRADCDLRDAESARRAMADVDTVLHLAADVGGLGYSRKHPARQYSNCSLLDLQVFDAACHSGIERLIGVSSSTAYPATAPSPLEEHDLFAGLPQKSHLGYGIAKRNLVVLAEVYREEHGLDAACVVANNAFGPGDDFEPATSHVIPALIRKCLEDEVLEVWGDGSAIRDFLYVEDLAEGILLAAEHLAAPGYVNIGSGHETTIADLVELVARLTGFEGEIHFDSTKPGGEPRRSVSIDKARTEIGFEPTVSLEEGLRRTIHWYQDTMRPAEASTPQPALLSRSEP